MEHNDQLHVEAEEALANINKKTGRNMPQAVATGAVLVIIILASLLIRIDVVVLLIVVFILQSLGNALARRTTNRGLFRKVHK